MTNETTVNAIEAPVTVAKPNATTTIPQADIDLGSMATQVSEQWATKPSLTLEWMQQATFATLVSDYQKTLTQRKTTGGTRPQITKRLKEQDKVINKHLDYVKGYLADKFGKDNAASYYAAFGIIKNHGIYILPRDRTKRNEALKEMVTGITIHGLEANTYGLTFWTDIANQYNDTLKLATGTDGTISQKVGTKNSLKQQVKKLLNSIVFLIKANYPDTYKAELRKWGFQKEKY